MLEYQNMHNTWDSNNVCFVMCYGISRKQTWKFQLCQNQKQVSELH